MNERANFSEEQLSDDSLIENRKRSIKKSYLYLLWLSIGFILILLLFYRYQNFTKLKEKIIIKQNQIEDLESQMSQLALLNFKKNQQKEKSSQIIWHQTLKAMIKEIPDHIVLHDLIGEEKIHAVLTIKGETPYFPAINQFKNNLEGLEYFDQIWIQKTEKLNREGIDFFNFEIIGKLK